MANFLHGVEIQEIDSGTKVIKTAKSSVIGIIGTAPDAEDSAFPTNTPILITGSKVPESLGKTGTLPKAIKSIFEQIGAVLVVVRIIDNIIDNNESNNDDNNENNLENENKIIDELDVFLAAESVIHVKPQILIAPGFSSNAEVLTAMIPIAEKLKAIIIADSLNTTDADAIAYAANFGSTRVYIVDPWVKVGLETLPPSPFVAGLIAKSDNEKGFWHSPSNQEILGITGLSRPVDFSFGDPNCSANLLNEHNVATIIHQGCYKLWGNRSCSSDPKWQFLSVRRTADIINESILRAHLWAVDRNITRTYLEDVSESVNAYLATLKAQGAILGGICTAPRDVNTPANVQDGKVYFDIEFTPPYPAESITFRSYLTNDYIKEVI
jgi:phage tail sheath protein FI